MSTWKTPPSGNQQQHAKPGFSGSNPFDSVPDSDRFGDSKDKGSGTTSPQVLHSGFSTAKARYKNDFRDSGGIENQSVQELQNYSAYKAEETTIKLNGCLKIAEEIREGASNTLVTLHQQGEQITRTHQAVADIEPDLSRGEKLLGSLGGLFSKKWKPKKTHKIKGPLSIKDDSSERSRHLEQRQRLGLAAPLPRSEPQHFSEPASALQKVEIEKAKQDDVLSDLSNLLGELKNMAIDMGSEFEKQNVALDRAQDDVDEMNTRVHGANLRGRRLLRK
ncbi:SNAP25 homologous protein SNAP33 [Musa acuminata AAA Group]|uniref:SNAP25 homologous protein SNAP33 n=1 Tax=Musa acuminata AAA Group TaxID=214697 RepID=UPI0031D0F1C0